MLVGVLEFDHKDCRVSRSRDRVADNEVHCRYVLVYSSRWVVEASLYPGAFGVEFRQ